MDRIAFGSTFAESIKAKSMKTNLRIFTERPHLRNPSLMVLMKLSVDGHFDKSCFEKALQKLKDVHPLLYSSIFINDDGDAFYQENAVQQLELYCAKREYPNQWMEVAESENKKPFNCEKGSLIRFFVFYSDTDFDILAAVHHLLGDGDAIARLLWDVMCLYAGNNLPVQEQTLISNENDFPPKARLSFPAKMLIRSLNTTWNKGTQPRFGEKEFQEMFNQYHQLADIGLSYSTINKSEIDGLHNVCKAHGLTVNTALVTAFIGAMQEEYPDSSDKKLNVGIPINIRKQLSFSPNGCLGSFASAIKIAYKYDSKKDFWQNAVLVNKKIKAKMKSTQAQWLLLNIYARMNPLLIDAMYFAAYGGCNDKAAQKAASMLSIDNASDTAVSNLGRLNFNSQIGAYSIRDWVFFAPKAPGSYAVLGVATFNDTMQIGYSFDRKIISSAMLGNIQSKLLYLLKTSSCQLHE